MDLGTITDPAAPPLVASEPTLAVALLRALRSHGAGEIFGIPGDFALPFFDAIERSGVLPLYTLSNEPSLGFAADAAARFRRAPSAVAVTYGAGALNLVNAVACAYAEKSPVVVVSAAPGRGDRESGILVHHQVKTLESQMAIFREITCDQARLDDVGRAPFETARVLASARRLSRPVYIEVPRDVFETRCDSVLSQPDAPIDQEALETCAEEILARLSAAQRPVLMAGVEIRRFDIEQNAARLARQLRIPVVTSLLGRGLLARGDAPLSGTYLGAAGDPAVSELVEGSDALFLMGEIVSDTTFGISHGRIDLRRAIHAFDGRVRLAHHTYDGVPLRALIDVLARRAQPLSHAAHVPLRPAPTHLQVDDARVNPIDIAAALNDLMEKRGRFPIAADVGDCLFTAMDLVHTDHVAPGYYATMGFGVPAALGIQAATGRRPIAIVGDGAFQMTGWELGNCKRYGWDPIVVVLNNSSWGMLAAFRPQARYTQIGDWDFAACAAPLGGEGHRVETRGELKRALERAARDRGRFHLLDVRMPPDSLSPTLRRFAAAISRP